MKTLKKERVTVKMEVKKTRLIFTNSKGISRSIPKSLGDDFKRYLIENTVACAIFPWWEDDKEYEFIFTLNQL